MRSSFLLMVFLFLFSRWGFAQEERASPRLFEYYIQLGYNIGGAMPIPLPEQIRKIRHYDPGFSPSIGGEVVYNIDPKWSLGAALRFDIKGMNITDSVQYFHTLISMDDAEFEGDFSGTNQTTAKNGYLLLPVYAVYNTGRNWRVKLGAYAGYLVRPYFRGTVRDGYIRKGNSLGEKVIIDKAVFNFDEKENKWDWGLHAGGEKKWSRFALSGDLQWGLRSLFPSSFKGVGFKMTNVYFTLSAKKQVFNR